MNLQTPEWGEIKLMVALPKAGNPWGALSPLQGTSWGEEITVVSGEDLSHALHGWAVPLMKNLGIDPKRRGHKIPEDDAWCVLREGCAAATSDCQTGSTRMPACYEPLGVDAIAAEVLLAWQEGWYVIVVDGPEFSF